MTKNRQAFWIALALGLVTATLFWPAAGFDFVNFDDPDYVVYNEAIHDGMTLKAVGWALTTGHASNWHPLTWISHMVDCQMFGPKAGGHHQTNVLLHTANVVLLFLVLRRLTGAMWRSAFVAALFAWHPLHVESVAWVSERKDVLSTFFWLLTMLAYGRYAEESRVQGPRSKVFYALALGCFGLGLMSKPMVVTLPFVLLLLDCWPLKRSEPWKRLVREKWPFFALSLLDGLATVWAQRGANSVVSMAALSLPERLANALVSYVLYLWKMLWPVDLAAMYPYSHQWSWLPVAGAGLLLGGISAAVFWRRRERPYLLVGWLWFLGTLVPVIGLVQVGVQFMADRYTYVPLIGVFVMLAWAIPEVLANRQEGRLALGGGAAIALALLLVCTREQLQYWRNSVTLFEHAASVTRDSVLVEYNLGEGLARQGRTEEAIEHYQKALAIQPNRVERMYNSQTEARFNLGAIYFGQRKWSDAETQFRAILRDQPEHTRAREALEKVLSAAATDRAPPQAAGNPNSNLDSTSNPTHQTNQTPPRK